jgi:hypothetical protein
MESRMVYRAAGMCPGTGEGLFISADLLIDQPYPFRS